MVAGLGAAATPAFWFGCRYEGRPHGFRLQPAICYATIASLSSRARKPVATTRHAELSLLQ